MKDLAIYGAGGFGKEVACLISLINRVKPKWHLIGFFDDGKAKGEKNEFGIILGGIDDLNAYDKPLAIVISIGIPSTVENLVAKIHNANVNFPNIIAPDLFFLDEPSVSMGNPFLAGLVAGAFTMSSLYQVFGMQRFKPVAHLSLITSLCCM